MSDPRVERLAELIVGYSLDLRPGQIVRIEGSTVAEPLAAALYAAALRRGAHPYVDLAVEGLAEHLVAHGSDEQLAHVSPTEWNAVELLDALVVLWADENTRSFGQADPDRHQRYVAARRQVTNRFYERVAAGEARWCGTLMPTNGHAQDAEMSLADYERFVYDACHVSGDGDPAEHWEGLASSLAARAEQLDAVRELRVVGPDTDLALVVEGRTWIAADGRLNMPDGEVFTSPVETATRGEIRFTFPAIFKGREVEDVRLRFEDGRVVASEASRGLSHLRAMLEMDDAASLLGEVAFGLNYEIDRFTRNILFDEKIGGTMHFALGSGFPEAGGRKQSGLHWDMICDLRADGEVYADGELIWRAGQFLADPQPASVRAG
jgi:aminopeptidase